MTNRSMRVARLCLPAVTSLLIAVAVNDHLARPRYEPGPKTIAAPLLSNEKARSEEGYAFTRMDGDRVFLTVQAKSNLELKNHENRLEDVQIDLLPSVKANQSRIHGAHCTTDPNVLNIRCDGGVRIETGAPTWELLAESTDLAISPEGVLLQINAQSGAQLRSANKRGPRLILTADQIRTDGSHFIETAGHSVLKTAQSVIEGTEFSIRLDDVTRVESVRRATLTSGARKVSADRTQVLFDSRTHVLRDLTQSGNFEFQTPDHRGRAAYARFEPVGNVLVMGGHASISDERMNLDADQIVLRLGENSVTANGGAQFSRADVRIRADRLRIFAFGPLQRVLGEGRVESEVAGRRSTSNRIEYAPSTGLVRYGTQRSLR